MIIRPLVYLLPVPKTDLRVFSFKMQGLIGGSGLRFSVLLNQYRQDLPFVTVVPAKVRVYGRFTKFFPRIYDG